MPTTTLTKLQTALFNSQLNQENFPTEGDFMYWAFKATSVISDANYNTMAGFYYNTLDLMYADTLDGTDEDDNSFHYTTGGVAKPARPRPIIHRP